ncbi:MAG: MATE family efflux transporter [Clostridia bacterium]|nr:MATE family efflux transporter [Clostridia bacterium]NCC43765.1 MATE family efflux transporter [Clostridia bacterium]
MNEAKNDFTQGNIASKLIQFMLPILGALVLQAMYGAVDILIVGKFGTTAGISGVSTGSNMINMIVFTISGLSMGLTVLIGRYLGEKNDRKIGKVIGGAICFFVAVSLVLAVLLVVLARPFAQLMRAPEEALDLTVQYVRICGGGIIFIIAYNLISSIFRGLGNSKLPLIFVAIACVANIFGDLLFIGVFKWNVIGAALATVMAQAISVVLSLLIIRRQKLPFTVTREDIRFNSQIKVFLRVGSPIAFQELLTQISFLALCAFINNLGLAASSGYGVANKIVSFVMLVPASLMQSMAAFIAQNVGAGLEKRARKTMLYGMGMGVAIGVFVGFGVFFKGDVVSYLFTSDAGVIVKSAEYLKGFALEAVVTCILFSFIGYFNGHNQTLFVMSQGIAQTFLVRLPLSYIMSIQPDASLTNIGLAAPSATVFGIILNLVFYCIYTRRMSQDIKGTLHN